MTGPQLTSKETVMAQVVEHGGGEAYKRITAYAKSKNIADDSEMWQWAEIFGFTAQVVEEMPAAMQAAMAAALVAHQKAIAAGDAHLAATAQKVADEAVARIAKSQAVSQDAVRKTGAEVMQGFRDQATEALQIGVFAAFEKPFIAKMMAMETEIGRFKKLVDDATTVTDIVKNNRPFHIILAGFLGGLGGAMVAGLLLLKFAK